MKATFQQVREFFLSWGLAPDCEEDDMQYSIRTRDGYIINSACYDRMRTNAEEVHGKDFSAFVSRSINAVDGSFYITADTWDELQEAWEDTQIV